MVLVAYSKSSPTADTTRFLSRSTANGIAQGTLDAPRTFSGGKRLDGFKNSSWRQQVELGNNATTPLVASEDSLEIISPGLAQVYGKTLGGVLWDQSIFYDSFYQEEAFDGSLLISVDNEARTKAFRQLSSDFKGLTFLAELREAVQMIRSPASSLRKGIEKYRTYALKTRNRVKLTRRGLIEFRKAIGGAWLEYAFGWAPLVGDIQAGYDALTDRISRPEFAPFKATYSQSRHVARRRVTGSQRHQIAWDIYLSGSEECSAYYQGTVKTTCTVSGLPEKLGLFPSEFVPTAWEIMPWSFLIDYFSNVGDTLDAWATVQRLTFGYVSSGTRRIRTSYSDVTFKPAGTGGAPLTGNSIGQAVVSRKNIVRGSSQSLPIPALQLKNKLSDSKLLNIAALIAGAKLDSQWKMR